MKNATTKTLKRLKEATQAHTNKKKPTSGIQWPAEWAATEGWVDPAGRASDGRTWAELDDEMKRQGTSLADRMAGLGASAPVVAATREHLAAYPERKAPEDRALDEGSNCANPFAGEGE